MSNETNMKKMQINYMILRDQIIVNFDSKNFTVNSGSDEYENVLRIIKNTNNPDPALQTKLEDLIPIVDPQGIINTNIPNGEFVVKNGQIYSDGVLVDSYIGTKILEFMEKGLPFHPLLNFWKRLKGNPSRNSIAQLYRFLESCKIPLTEDGKFIAYKSVRSDMKDHHSGKFQYELNKLAQMDRSQVVDSPDHACGPGLHVGAYSYASSFGSSNSIILEVEVDPADVVSVPKDHGSRKLRACQFIPVAICQREYSSPVVITSRAPKKDIPFTVTPAATATPTSAGTSEAGTMIGRNQYSYATITSASFDSLGSRFPGVVDIRPSKAAASLRSLVPTYGVLKSCVRFNDGEAICYACQYVKDETSTYVIFTPAGYTFVEAAVVEAGNLSELLAGITVSKRKFVASMADNQNCIENDCDGVRSLSRSKYPVELLAKDPSSTLITRVLRGTAKSDGMSRFLVFTPSGMIYLQPE